MGEIITRTDKEVLRFFDEMERVSALVDAVKSSYAPPLNGERYITDTKLAGMRKNSLLPNWRENSLSGKRYRETACRKSEGSIFMSFNTCLNTGQTVCYEKEAASP